MLHRGTALVFLVSLFQLAACGSSNGRTNSPAPSVGSAQVVVALTVRELTAVECVITADDMSNPMSSELGILNDSATGIIAQIPAGVDRTFTINAYRDAELVCTGSAVADVLEGERVVVAVTVQCAADPQSVGEAELVGTFNFPPTIDSAVASRATVPAGGTVDLSASATDPDGDAVTYLWSSPDGSFSETAQPATVWTAPSVAGVNVVTVTASDDTGASSSVNIAITVE